MAKKATTGGTGGRFQKLEYQSFITLDTNFPTEIPDNHLSDSMNMIRREDGMWENRKGIKQFGADVGSNEAIHSLRFWKTSTGSRFLTIGTGDKIYSYTEGSSYDNGTYTSRKTLTDPNANKWDSIVYRDIIVIGDGVNDLQTSTDNVTFTSRAPAGDVVKASMLEVGNDFVWFTGIPNDNNKVVYSGGAPTDPWKYSASNIVNLDIGNADQVTAMKSLGTYLVITKQRQTYAIQLADQSRSTLDWGGGCESNRAMQHTQLNSIFIAGRQGIFDIKKTQIGDNQLFGSPESDPIKNLYNKVTDYSTINGIYVFKDNWVLWNADTSLGSLTFLRNLDFSDKVWTYLYGFNSNDWTIYEDADGGYHYLYADAATDKVWEAFTGRNDNGAPILSRISTKRTDFGSPGLKKRITYIDIYGYISQNAEWHVEGYKNDDQSTPVINYVIDETNITSASQLAGLATSPLGTVPLGGKLDASEGDIEALPFYARIPVDADFEKIQMSLWNNQVDARVILKSIVFYVNTQPIDLFDNDYII